MLDPEHTLDPGQPLPVQALASAPVLSEELNGGQEEQSVDRQQKGWEEEQRVEEQQEGEEKDE